MMFALLMKSNDEVAVINVANMTMPALFIKEEDAMQVLYKNDLHHQCYVGRVRPEIYMVNNEDTRNPESNRGDD